MTETPTQAGSRVLVFGDDGSPGADVAWLWINNHAWPGWRAEVVHATLPPLVGAPLDTPPVLTEWEPPQPRVAFTESGLDDVRHLTVEVDPRIALDSCTHADLMVVGARGRGMLKALGVGSTTDWLLHRPLTPLVVVRSARPIHRALVCVDGSVHADAAVRAFATMPWLPQVDVVVLGVDDGRAEPASACETAQALLGSRAGQVTTVLTAGGATSAILDAVARRDSDLVVLGTRGLTGLRRLRVGSTASAVARDTDRTTLLAMARTESDDDE